MFTEVTNASELLGLDAFQLSEVLTQRSIILRGEEICSPLTIEQVYIYTYMCSPFPCIDRAVLLQDTYCHSFLLQLQAVDSRDSVAMALYSQCFSWIILKINQKIKGKENFKSIGILDIFGFENFEVRTPPLCNSAKPCVCTGNLGMFRLTWSSLQSRCRSVCKICLFVISPGESV